MKKNLILLLLFFSALATISPAEEMSKQLQEDGRMLIFFRGTEVGYEEYSFYKQSDGRFLMETKSEFILPKGSGNVSFKFITAEVMDAKFNPIHYNEIYWMNGVESYVDVSFSGGQASDAAQMGGRVLNRTAKVSSSFRLIEEAVFSHYYLLVKKYTLKGEDNQRQVPVYYPKIANEMIGKVKFVGTTRLRTPIGEIPARKYNISIGGFQGATLSVNNKGQIITLDIPKQELLLRRDFAYDFNKLEQGPSSK